MPKPEIEFTPLSTFPLVTTSPTEAASRTLAKDESTGDMTILLIHPPGQEWGGAEGKESQANHIYWEEVLILKGRIYDKSLGKWFGKDSFCCRPPGMLHGPWISDPIEGCEEIVWVKHV